MTLEVVNMKVAGVVVLLGLILFIQHTECMSEKHQKVFTECIAESGASPELVMKAFRDGEFANDEKLKCYFKCMHKKAGYMDDGGKIDAPKFVEMLGAKIGEDKAGQIILGCKDSKGSNACDTAFVFSKCLHKQFKELGLDHHHH